MKFKIGDRVKVIIACPGSTKVGERATVQHDSQGYFIETDRNSCVCYHQDYWKKIEELSPLPKVKKAYCTKHSLFHGHKYPSCMTKKEEKIEREKFIQLIANPFGIAGLTRSGKVYLLKKSNGKWIEIQMRVDAFNSTQEERKE